MLPGGRLGAERWVAFDTAARTNRGVLLTGGKTVQMINVCHHLVDDALALKAASGEAGSSRAFHFVLHRHSGDSMRYLLSLAVDVI